MADADFNLITRIYDGDQAAENELCAFYSDRILRKVRQSLGQECDDCPDVVNEIFMAVIISLRKGLYKPEKGNPLGSYIYGIARKKIGDYFVKKKKIALFGNPRLNELKTNPIAESELENKELRQALGDILSGLEKKYRIVLYLRYFKGLKVSQISRKINLPPRRVSERINYALKLLRKEYKKRNLSSIL